MTLADPAGLDVGDLVGAERTFVASCDQPSTLTFYLDGDPVHTSGLGVREASHPFPSGALGEHTVRVVATNENGSGENSWTWNVVSTPPVITSILPGSDCLWVNTDQTIRFNLNVKLFENADDFMELNEEISIDSSQDPIAL